MRSKHIKFLIGTAIMLLVTASATLAQSGLGSPTKATPTNKSSSPAPRTRRANVVRHGTPKASEPTEDGAAGASSAKPVEMAPPPGTEEMKQGLEAYNKEDYDTAIEKLKAAGELKPADAVLFYALGDSYSFKKEWEKAIEAYVRARKYSEALATADNFYNLGSAYEQTGKYGPAFEAFQRANEKKSGNAETLTRLGDVTSKLGQWQSAVEYYEQAFRIDPNINDGDVFYNWGVAYVNTSRNYEAALRRFQRAIELNVENIAEAYYQLGVACRMTGRIDDAINDFNKQLERKNDDQNAWLAYYMLCQLYSGKRDWAAAARAGRSAVHLNSKDHLSWYNVGAAENNLNHFREAAEAYLNAATLSPDNPDYQLDLGKAYYRTERPAEALEALSKATQLKPKFSEAYYFIGLTYYRFLKQFDRALEALNTALDSGLETKMMEANARYFIAVSYAKLGNPAAVRQQCDLLKTMAQAPADTELVCRP